MSLATEMLLSHTVENGIQFTWADSRHTCIHEYYGVGVGLVFRGNVFG